jgi:hypothetical protein
VERSELTCWPGTDAPLEVVAMEPNDTVWDRRHWSNRRNADARRPLPPGPSIDSEDGYFSASRRLEHNGLTLLRRLTTTPGSKAISWDVSYTVQPGGVSRVTADLVRKHIPHTWDLNEVTVPGRYERAVDRIIERHTVL